MENILDTYTKLLREYVSFKSVSTDLAYKPEINKTVEWLTLVLKEYGFNVEVWNCQVANPVVFGSLEIDSKLPTVLVYGHYDVQPAKKEDGWTADPFELSTRNGRLYARGVVDNKGQNLTHIVTIGELYKAGKLAYNVKFMIEGNEETGNPEMAGLVAKYSAKLKADQIIISDGEIVGSTPTVECSLRGGFNMTVVVKTGKTNLHSGLYGGAVPSSSHELSKILATFFDKNNKVVVPGFYNDIPKLSKEILKQNKSIQSEKEVMKIAGVKAMIPEKGMDFFTQTGMRPTLQVTGIKTGYIDEGYANIVPASAEARINVRLVGKQNPKKVYEAVCKYIKAKSPKYVDVTFTHTEFNEPVNIDTSKKEFNEVKDILKKAYKKTPITKYVGGGIPIVTDFKKILKKDTLLISLGNDDCNMHGLDENFKLDLVKKGLEFSKIFFSKK